MQLSFSVTLLTPRGIHGNGLYLSQACESCIERRKRVPASGKDNYSDAAPMRVLGSLALGRRSRTNLEDSIVVMCRFVPPELLPF